MHGERAESAAAVKTALLRTTSDRLWPLHVRRTARVQPGFKITFEDLHALLPDLTYTAWLDSAKPVARDNLIKVSR